jgi:hypothetical protein
MLKAKTTLSKVSFWLMALALVLIVIQGWLVWKYYARPLLGPIRRFGLISSFQRGEILYIGFKEAQYVRFLDALIPKDSPVILPDPENASFTSQSVMQFYLFPRPIWGCGKTSDATCLADARDPSSFLLSIRNFPPNELTKGKVFIAFPGADNGLNGVFVPENLAGQLAIPGPDIYERLTMIPIQAPFIETGILGLFFLLGYVIVSLLLPKPTWLDFLGLSIPLAIGILSWVIFITSFIGIPITLATVTFWYALLLIAGIGGHRLLHKPLRHATLNEFMRSIQLVWKRDHPAFLLSLAVVGWFALMALISVGRTYTVFDDIVNWYMKGYAMAAQHTFWAGDFWGGHVLAYPMNIQLSTSIFQLVDGDQLPGSKALFPILAFSLLLGCYRFLRGHAVRREIALLLVLLVATLPLFFKHATIGMANLPLASYLVLGILWSFDGFLNQKTSWLVLGGTLLALAAWTRPEGIGYSLVMLAGIFCVAVIGMKVKMRLTHLAATVLPILIIPTSWLVLLGYQEMNEDQIGNALGDFVHSGLSAKFIWDSLGQIATFGTRFFSDWPLAGFLLPLSLVAFGILVFVNRHNEQKLPVWLFLISCLAAAFPVGMFFVASFSEKDFWVFLSQSFDRAFLPAIVLFAVSVSFAFGLKKTVSREEYEKQT